MTGLALAAGSFAGEEAEQDAAREPGAAHVSLRELDSDARGLHSDVGDPVLQRIGKMNPSVPQRRT